MIVRKYQDSTRRQQNFDTLGDTNRFLGGGGPRKIFQYGFRVPSLLAGSCCVVPTPPFPLTLIPLECESPTTMGVQVGPPIDGCSIARFVYGLS